MIEGWMRNFVWSGCIDQKKLVNVSWKNCCRNFTKGDLGIISLKAYNSASNMNLCWTFLNNKQDWCQLLKARVKRNGRIIKHSIKSSIWIGIKEAHQSSLDNCKWIIGNGKTDNFWLDDWLGISLASKFKIPEKYHNTLTLKVGDWWHNHCWNVGTNTQMAFPTILNLISSTVISDLDVEDSLVWKNSSTGVLAMKDAYKHIIKPCPSLLWSSFPWDCDSPSSHSKIVW